MKRLVTLALLTVLISACAVQPAYNPPTPQTPPAWQAQLPHQGNTDELLHWWSQFQDPILLKLLAHSEQHHPSLEKAAAAIQESRATWRASNAAEWPNLNGTLAVNRGSSVNAFAQKTTNTTRSGKLDASWELDLFNALDYTSAANAAKTEARVGDWHQARISLAAEVATQYINHRACTLQQQTAQDTLSSQEKTQALTRTLIHAGLSAPSEEQLSLANVADARTALETQRESCEFTIKSLVRLSGMSEPEVRGLLDEAPQTVPQPSGFSVNSMPMSLISQRPDVMSAERALAAAYAEAGASQADRYPRLSLGGNITGNIMNSHTISTWSFGPALVLPVFDAGRRKALSEAAQARHAQALASYKNTVQAAIEEVEKALVHLRSLQDKLPSAQQAVLNYKAVAGSTQQHWAMGGASLLEVETVQRNAIAAEQALLGLQRDQVNAWIALYKAVGGAWQTHSLEQITP